MRHTAKMQDEFKKALKSHQPVFGIELTEANISALVDYYALINEHNAILHLVAPMSAEEFAIRHILESLTLLEYLPPKARFADVGTGAGLPSIPCLLVRDDLKAVLIESKEKKVNFLKTAVKTLGLSARVQVVNRQFEETDVGNCEYVMCRALDKFTEKLPRLLKWSMRRGLLLFGGNNLKEALKNQKVKFDVKLMPLSEQRFLFILLK